ncbi:helix-turn-helix domain-containing protein [Fructilactobacillus cliffordii]|uniref:Helix-turn-helix domain-containing protein n=1 Tax=Fructilactobacillus cliffordii TaxID=2940299 RepID=A0A9Q9E3R9_9LACO|nr:helix-turn-helix transcriptional regulator [Fructilactobacillus cliffordii]USS86816.1 helix-turn-helix domain-containing protein [Fructilactobacillus cliffordii]USS89813.1 helix-turn-helix domain-containing protein [Fructilactobacillus cliffordii]
MSEENKQASNPEIGAQLKAAREKAGLSVDELQKQTKIQKRYLTAIENDDFAALPGQFYVRAFVKQYANAVGLNGEQFLQDSHLTTAKVNPDADSLKSTEPAEASDSRTSNRPTNSPNLSKNQTQMDRQKMLPLLGLVVIVIIIIGVVIFAVAKTRQDSSATAPKNAKVTVTNDDAKKKRAKKTEKQAPKNNLKEGQTEIKQVKDSTSDFTVKTGNATSKLDLAATQATTVTVKLDGNQVYSGTLNQNAGHQVDIPKNTKEVNIHLTNAPISSVKLNDQQVMLPQPAAGQDANQRDMNFKFEW